MLLKLLPAWISLALAGHLRGGEDRLAVAQCPSWSRGLRLGPGWRALAQQSQVQLSECSTFCATAPNTSGSAATCLFQRPPLGDSGRCLVLAPSRGAEGATDGFPADIGEAGESFACQLPRTPVVSGRRRPSAAAIAMAPLLLQVAAAAAPDLAAASWTDVMDDPYKMLVVAAVSLAAVALLLSTVAIYLLCRVLSVYKRLARGGREMPLSQSSGTELVAMRRVSVGQSEQEDFLDCEDPNEDSAMVRRVSQTLGSFHGIALQGEVDFNGTWECIETFGLDGFLQAMKVGRIRRMAAAKAPWPQWQFTQKGKEFTYVNKSKFGVMTEQFSVDGTDYQHKDLEGNITTCKASLQGSSLIIERKGANGSGKETRTIKDGNTLEFMLQMDGIPVTWGRKFTRKSKSTS